MIQFHHVSLAYPVTGTHALEDINLHVKKGEFVYLVGHSGAGKSSFMNLILKRTLPTSGQVYIAGESLSRYRGRRVAQHRRRIGMVFQDNLLLPHLSVHDNIAFALRVTGAPEREWGARVGNALRVVGLDHKRHALPIQLSQGEQQRIAIARAIVTEPALLLADEPTGNLDPDNSRDILKVLQHVNLRGTTVVLATHARDLVETFRHRTITLRQGRLVRDDPYGGYAL
ncbi:cell division ATP-binding protein FtsE [Deinococcus maricopensis]|uniref:Cell division ATP-binding protein FtsE n=1 Tax=Deinococcus maricopensis (strain DSM 21211 / LMG 22137 / NRRL B-23946 / LB-34) TaxID=709986 RepID=E8UAD9_DEIML|nr:cell division ATP-binding protein FtsE [Deinococcus maricopensis]ADV68028.1 cell division ATP-binding protein FtsE [Deinococcus maricopensis DSM 21211]